MALSDRTHGTRSTRLLLIGIEGEIGGTDHQYFDRLRKELHLHRAKCILVPTDETHASAPEHVLARIKEKAKSKGYRDDLDSLWMLVDKDSWEPHTLVKVTKEANQFGCEVAISNPCFELWLILHYCDVSAVDFEGTYDNRRSQKCKKWLGVLRAAKNGDLAIERLSNAACKRAQNLDTAAMSPIPNFPGTRIYLLFAKMQELGILSSFDSIESG